jgi:hypothetical protein
MTTPARAVVEFIDVIRSSFPYFPRYNGADGPWGNARHARYAYTTASETAQKE